LFFSNIKIFRLFEQGLYSDVTFVIDERIFSLHRCVLAARSSFFQEAFEKRWHEKRYINLTKAKVIFFLNHFNNKKKQNNYCFSLMQKVLKLLFDIYIQIVVK
jgi:hypothetical protein